MKIFSASLVALLIIFQSVSFAEVKTFSASGEYTMSDYDTPEIAERRALEYARRNAVEQAGIYLESYSRTVDFQLEQDEIKTVASDNIKILDEPKISREILTGGVPKIRVDIKASVDTAALDAAKKRSQTERQQAISQYEDLQRRTLQLDKDIAELKRKIAELKADEPNDEISEEQERIDREFLSMQKTKELDFDEAIKINPRNCDAYEKRASRTYATSSPQEAMKDFTRAIALEPENATRYNRRAGFRFAEFHDYEGAVKDYDEALNVDPENFSAIHGFYSIYHSTLKDNARGIEHLTEVIKLHPQNQYAYCYRGDFYKDEKNFSRAIEDYTQALKLNPKDKYALEDRAECYRKLKDYKRAVEDYERLTEIDLGFACSGLKSLYRFDLEDYAGGIKHFDALIKRYPNSPKPYEGRAYLYREMKDYPRAIEDYKQAARQLAEDGSWSNRYNRGRYYKIIAWLYNESGDTANVAKTFTDLVSLNPNNDYYHSLRGDYLQETGDYDNAIKEYLTAIRLSPDKKTQETDFKNLDTDGNGLYSDLTEYITVMGYTHSNKNLYNIKDKDAVAKAFTELINSDPNNPKFYELRANFYKKINDITNAVKDYNSAMKLDRDNSAYYEKRIQACKQGDDYTRNKNDTAPVKTIEDYTREIKLQPNNKALYKSRGELHAKNGDYDKAIADYTKALEIDPHNVACHTSRAEAYVKKEDYAHAIEDYTWLGENDLRNFMNYRYFRERAKIYERLGEYDNALDDYDNAIEAARKHFSIGNDTMGSESDLKRILDMFYKTGVVVEPRNFKHSWSFKACGDFYRDKGNLELAVKYYTRAVELDPDYAYLRFKRAAAYIQLGDKEKAVADLDQIELRKLSKYTLNDRAKLYEQLGEYNKALADYDKAIELDQNYETAKKNRQLLLDKMKK